ncbi:hypothetical protein MTBLM1_130022 [Rhodospirillaceae bacterium LM-1]|nr:hypothetical protein MTBLM1_130022 [Rhodospirillaceae bacterium LM-1]
MTVNDLHALFERLFGLEDSKAAAPKHAVGQASGRADISAELDKAEGGHAEFADNPDESVAVLAAYLDGGLGDEEMKAIHAKLAHSPAAFGEAEAALAFLDAVQNHSEAPPEKLILTAGSRLPQTVPSASKGVSPKSRFAWWLSGSFAAIAAAIVIAVFIFGHLQNSGSNSAPVAKTSPSGPSSQPTTEIVRTPPTKLPGSSPTDVAGEKKPPQQGDIVPVGSSETAPAPAAKAGGEKADCAQPKTPRQGGELAPKDAVVQKADPCAKDPGKPTTLPAASEERVPGPLRGTGKPIQLPEKPDVAPVLRR